MDPAPSNTPQGPLDPESSITRRKDSGAEDLSTGATLGKYRIIGRLGHGGMGVVFEAEDTALHRVVAIKVLPELSSADPDLCARFEREAVAAARLSHPNVVTIYDVGSQGGMTYLVMELVRGENAQEMLTAKGALPWLKATRILLEVCSGVAAAHAAGLIHRDIKPGNIILTTAGTPKLADFGLAKATDSSAPTFTVSGSVLGTPHFMSPEQCRSETVDARSDVYALGATYYALLTGTPPYAMAQPLQIMFAHCSSPVPDPREVMPKVPEHCAAIVRRAMAKKPDERYSSARALQADLRNLLEEGGSAASAPTVVKGEPVVLPAPVVPLPQPRARRQPVSWVAWCGGAAVLAMLVAFVLHRRTNDQPAPFSAAVASSPVSPPTTPVDRTDPGPPARIPEAVVIQPSPTGWREALDKSGSADLALDGAVATVAFSPDGKWLAAGMTDGSRGIVAWDFKTGRERLRRWGGKGIHSIAFSPDSRTLAAAGEGDLLVMDLEKESDTRILTGGGSRIAYSICFSMDGKSIAAGLAPQEGEADPECVLLADRESGKKQALQGQKAAVSSVVFSPDGSMLVSGALDGSVILWEYPSLQLKNSFSAGVKIRSVAIPRDMGLVAVAGDRSVQVWSPTGVKVGDSWTSPHGEILSIAFSPRELLMAVSGEQVHLWGAPPGTERGKIEGHTGSVCGMSFSSDGQFLATACADRTVRVRDLSKVMGGR